jgi:1-acyl-sn-glycerol-3-phosphate acyltransferase
VSSRGSQSETSAERWGRRAITIPSYLLGGAGLLLSLPLLLPLTLLLDVIRANRLAAVRTLLFAVHYVVCEALGLSASLLLWLANLFRPNRQRFLARHYSLQYLWASLLFLGACRLFSIRLRAEPDERTGEAPLLVFIRHASIVDTLLPAVLLCRGGLRLRYVMKRELLWDPCLDVVGNRLPNLFVRRDSGESSVEIEKIRRLAGDLSPGEGVLIYPEGTRFSPAKRERVLARLERSADPERLARVRRLRHVLPPRLGGPLALLDAAPDADVLLVAHVGFDGISHFRDAWSGSLIGRTVRVQAWHIPRSAVPCDREEQIDWLDGLWERVDAWIDEHKETHLRGCEDSSDPARPPDRGETSRGRRVTAQK